MLQRAVNKDVEPPKSMPSDAVKSLLKTYEDEPPFGRVKPQKVFV